MFLIILATKKRETGQKASNSGYWLFAVQKYTTARISKEDERGYLSVKCSTVTPAYIKTNFLCMLFSLCYSVAVPSIM